MPDDFTITITITPTGRLFHVSTFIGRSFWRDWGLMTASELINLLSHTPDRPLVKLVLK